MSNLSSIRLLLERAAYVSPKNTSIYFKTGSGDYSEHDQFLGVRSGDLHVIAKQYLWLSFEEIEQLLASVINEERLLALFMLVGRYKKSDIATKEAIYQLYLRNIKQVNNWNLVDASAHLIVGAHLHDKDKDILMRLAYSCQMWERRIAIVATWYFIRKDEFLWTLKIARILLHDDHDLIHKAVGWMLREMGKRDISLLHDFLKCNAPIMPRTMLRYSIEKLSKQERTSYLALKHS